MRVKFLTQAAVWGAAAMLLRGALVPFAVFADEVQDLENIRSSAREFALSAAGTTPGQKVEAEVGTLDPRLRLASCTAKLEAFLPAGAKSAGNTTVGVRCPGPKPWTVYVPVRVKRYGQVLVAAHPVAKGTVLQEADIRFENRDMAALADAPLTEHQQALGRLVRRPLVLGGIITGNDLQAARLIRRGEKVVILAVHGGVEVRASGEALMDGAEGDRIRVRNSLTHIVIQATVTAAGVVRVIL